jgi:tryptophanyl-tRNA synthetase
MTGKSFEEIEKLYEGKMYGHLKVDLAEIVVSTLTPVREKYLDLMKNQDYLDKLMNEGAMKAEARSEITLKKVYEATGLVPRKR